MLAGTVFPTDYHAELVNPTQYGNVLAGSAAGNQLSPNGSYAGGTSRFAFISYVVAALVAVLLIAQAITGSWRLGLTSFLALPCLPVRRGARHVRHRAAADARRRGGAARGIRAGRPGWSSGWPRGCAPVLRTTVPPTRGAGGPATGTDLGSPALTAVPVLVTAVTLVPFIVMGDVPGMELLHTAAAVILGGLATTALVCLVVLPVAGRLLGPAPAPESDESLPGSPWRAAPTWPRGSRCRARASPPTPCTADLAGARASDVEHALVRDNPPGNGDGLRHGPPHRPEATDAGPPADTQPGDASRFREDA